MGLARPEADEDFILLKHYQREIEREIEMGLIIAEKRIENVLTYLNYCLDRIEEDGNVKTLVNIDRIWCIQKIARMIQDYLEQLKKRSKNSDAIQ